MAGPGEGRGTALVLLGALALVGVVVVTSRSPVPPPPAGPDASLVVQADRLSVTQGGVLVVPLLLRNVGPAVEVARALVYAEPVVEDALLLRTPVRVDAAGSQRLVALVAPDCRLLQPRAGLEFAASVLVRVRSEGGSADLVADLHDDAVLAARVRALCTRTPDSTATPDSTTPAPGSQGRAPSRGD